MQIDIQGCTRQDGGGGGPSRSLSVSVAMAYPEVPFPEQSSFLPEGLVCRVGRRYTFRITIPGRIPSCSTAYQRCKEEHSQTVKFVPAGRRRPEKKGTGQVFILARVRADHFPCCQRPGRLCPLPVARPDSSRTTARAMVMVDRDGPARPCTALHHTREVGEAHDRGDGDVDGARLCRSGALECVSRVEQFHRW